MTILSESETAQVAPSHQVRPATSWFAVVGFDGTEPSRAALAAATDLARERNGHLEVVYVGHVPAFASMSAQAVQGIRQGFPVIARDLSDTVRSALEDSGAEWHFQLRDGGVAAELLAAAAEVRGTHGGDATIMIIIGSSPYRMHHAAGSVASSLMHERDFSLLMVPPVKDDVAVPDGRHQPALISSAKE